MRESGGQPDNPGYDAYAAAKMAARMGKAKSAHDTVVAAAHRAQADALEIEAGAKRRLADEYDAAQERGEVMGKLRSHAELTKPTAADIGLSRKDIHEARAIRDAEQVRYVFAGRGSFAALNNRVGQSTSSYEEETP